MAKPRKGEKYVPEINTLLRDALPTWREIEGERDSQRRRANKRAQDKAVDELVTIYRDHEARGKLGELDPRVRMFCEDRKRRNGDKLPGRKGGRPADLHRRLLIAISVRELVESRNGTQKAVELAFVDVAAKFNITPRTVRDIYYDRKPEWMKVLGIEIARRRYENNVR
jgi:hypothetical protein